MLSLPIWTSWRSAVTTPLTMSRSPLMYNAGSDLLKQENKDYFYIMHMSWEGRYREERWKYARKYNIIGLQHNKIEKNWVIANSNIKKSISKIWQRQFDYFCNMKAGDIVVIMCGFFSILGVAQIGQKKVQYKRKLTPTFFDHVREVEWVKKYKFDMRRPLKKPIRFTNTLALIDETSKRWKSLRNEEI